MIRSKPVRPRAVRAATGLLAIAAGLAGCASLFPTSQYRLYALDTVPALQTARCPETFSIREFRVAGYLDREELVVGREGGRLLTSADDVWAAPFKADGSRVMTRLLLARLQGSRAYAYPWRLNEMPALAWSFDIDRMEPVGGQLQAMIRWTLVAPQDNTVIDIGSFDTLVPLADNGAANVVAAINLAFGRLADDLAARATGQSGLALACKRAG